MNKKILSGFIAIAVMTACSPKNSGSQNVAGPNTGQSATPVDSNQSWQQLKTETDSSATSGAYSGMLMISIDQTRQTLNLTLPLPPLALLPISMIAFNQLPGTTIQSDRLADGTDVWQLAIPLKYVLKNNVQLGKISSLPNGDPIPYFPAGEVNGFSVTVPQNPDQRITIYLAASAVAVFIETPSWQFPSGMPAIWTLVSNQAKTRQIGFLEIVPNKGAFSSGVYLAAKLPDDIARILSSIIKF